MKTSLLWDRDAIVAAFVSDQFMHIDGFGEGRAVGWVDDVGNLVGGVVLVPRGGAFDAEVSIYLDPGVVTTRAQWRDLFGAVFCDWGLVRITAHVAKKNRKSRRFVERLGFCREGALRLGYDGRQTAIVYGMTKNDCRWIKDD